MPKGDDSLVLIIANGDTLGVNNQSSTATMRKTLTEFVDEHGQLKAAEMLGMTQGALSKALGRGRVVFVEEQEGGVIQAEEVRPFPSKSTKSAA